MARKRIFSNTIADKIIELINSDINLGSGIIKTVSKGDLTTLPSVETIQAHGFIDKFFPAILICPEDIYHTTVDAKKSIGSSEYYFTIRYLRHFGDNDYLNVMEAAINDAETVADVLLGDEDLSTAPNTLTASALVGDQTLLVGVPCTMNKQEIIKLGNETFRIMNITSVLNGTATLLQLNATVVSDHAIGSVIKRTVEVNTPSYIELCDRNNVPIGQILRTEVPHLSIDTIEQEVFFRSKNIPVIMINIEYIVVFRSYYAR